MSDNNTKLVYLGRANIQGSPISIADVGSNKLAILTNQYTLYLVDKNDSKIGASATLIRESKPLHVFAKSLSASVRRDVCVVPYSGKAITILSFGSGSFSKKADLRQHEEAIEASAFSKDGHKFASGDIEGEVFVYDTSTYGIILKADKLGDYVSYITFSNDSRHIAISSYGRTISIYDIDRAQKSHHSAVNGLIERMEFFADDKIIFITRELGCGVYDLAQKRVTSYKSCFTSWPTSIALTTDKRYAFIGTKTNYMYIMRLADNEKVMTLKLVNETGVSSLFIAAGKLFIGHVNGEIEMIDVEQSVKELSVYLKSKEWEKAADICKKNSLLGLYPELLKHFELGWKEALPKAIAAISRGNIDVATAMCKPFLDDEKRASEFKFYVAQSKKVGEFVGLVEAKDFTKAYNMTASAPFLRKTPTYDTLERHWDRAFEAAKKMLDEDPIGNRLPVQHVLKPFAANAVTKPRISGLMSNYAKYIESDEALKARDFSLYFELCNKHSFLRDTSSYKKAVQLGEALAEKFQKLETEEMYREALQTAKMLTGFPAYSSMAFEKVSYLSDLVAFLDLVDDAIYGNVDAIKSVYDIASSQPKFQSVREFQILMKRFHDISNMAQSKAIDGAPSAALSLLDSYLDIPYWSKKIKDIMRTAYSAEMLKAAKAGQRVGWGATFEQYLSLFGKDMELERFAEHIKESAALKNISTGRMITYSSGYPKSILAPE